MENCSLVLQLCREETCIYQSYKACKRQRTLKKGPVVSECLKDFVSCPGGYTRGVDSAHFRAPIAEMPHSDSLKIRGLE